MDNQTLSALKAAHQYCIDHNVEIPIKTLSKMRRAGIFRRTYKGKNGYDDIRAKYWGDVADAVAGYLESTKPSTSFKSSMKRAIVTAFTDAVNAGYQDGGGSMPLDDETNSWLTSEQNKELANCDSLFDRLALMRKEDDVDPVTVAYRTAEGYANTLDGLYNSAVLYGMKNKMLTFTGEDGEESCKTCTKLKGQRHRASWWIAHDYVPPSGDGLDCSAGGWCQHYLETDDGEQVTI
jgi:hypothetical protein